MGLRVRDYKAAVSLGEMKVRAVKIPEHYSAAKKIKYKRDMGAALLYLTDPAADWKTVAQKFRCSALKDPKRKGKVAKPQWINQMLRSGIKFLGSHGGIQLLDRRKTAA